MTGRAVRMPIKGRKDLVEINTKTLPGSLSADGPGLAVDPADYDLIALAMQEPQFGARDVLPALTNAGLTTKALVYDPQLGPAATIRRMSPSQPNERNPDRRPSLARLWRHAWRDDCDSHTCFPTMGHFETEHSGFVTNSDQAKVDFPEIIQNMRNWARGIREVEFVCG